MLDAQGENVMKRLLFVLAASALAGCVESEDFVETRELVRQASWDPASVTFSGMRETENGSVCGWVVMPNRFGGANGAQAFVHLPTGRLSIAPSIANFLADNGLIGEGPQLVSDVIVEDYDRWWRLYGELCGFDAPDITAYY